MNLGRKIAKALVIKDIFNYILNSKWCVAILLFSFFEPSGGIQHFSGLNSFYFVFRLFSAFIMGSIITYEIILQRKISTNFFIIVLFYVLLYLITASRSFEGANILLMGIVYRIFKFGFIELALKRNTFAAVSGLSILFASLVGINFSLMLIYPEGLFLDAVGRRMYFLGIGNSMTLYVIHGMNFIVLRYILSKKAFWLQLVVFFTISMMTFRLVTSDTGLVVVTLFLIIFILWRYITDFKYRFFRFSILFSLFLILQVALVFFQVTLLLEGVGEDFNYILSGRTYVWSEGMKMFWESPLFGYGRLNGGRLIPIPGSAQTWGTNNPMEVWAAHNAGLQLMLEMGLVGVLLLSWLFFETARSLKKIVETKEASLIAVGLFAVLVSGLTEGNDIFMLILAVIVAINVGNATRVKYGY